MRKRIVSTGTVDPRVGICLSPLNISDGFYLYASWLCYMLAGDHSDRLMGAHTRGTMLVGFSGQFFLNSKIKSFFCFVVAVSDLVHDGRVIVHLKC